MPAVTYWAALETMRRDGDAVVDYIEAAGIEPPASVWEHKSWAQWACDLVSAAVELWAASIADDLADQLDEAAEVAEEGEQ